MSNDTNILYKQFETDAGMIAERAMEILVSMQGKETIAVQKDEGDASTSADIAAEKCIVDFIKKKYPTHCIYSEEMVEINGTEPFRWVIDPLDQTKEYMRGVSIYNCLVAIEEDCEVVAGITLHHGVNELYKGSKGNGATLNDKAIHVSDQSNFSLGFIGFNLPHRKLEKSEVEKDLQILSSLISTVYRVRPSSDQSKSMGYVARGVLDGNIAPPHVYKWHDVASSVILVKEAGGMITDWFGNSLTEKTSANGIVASNGKIHDQLLKIVQQHQSS
jgi:myo-inositol-1(or 4)-monophosphatase